MNQYLIKFIIRLLNSITNSQRLPDKTIICCRQEIKNLNLKYKDAHKSGSLSKTKKGVTFKQQLT